MSDEALQESPLPDRKSRQGLVREVRETPPPHRLLQDAESLTPPSREMRVGRQEKRKRLTLGEAWRVVVDVGQLDGDGGGPRQPTQVPPHVLGLEQNQVLVLGLSVHVGHGRAENPCQINELISLNC